MASKERRPLACERSAPCGCAARSAGASCSVLAGKQKRRQGRDQKSLDEMAPIWFKNRASVTRMDGFRLASVLLCCARHRSSLARKSRVLRGPAPGTWTRSCRGREEREGAKCSCQFGFSLCASSFIGRVGALVKGFPKWLAATALGRRAKE